MKKQVPVGFISKQMKLTVIIRKFGRGLRIATCRVARPRNDLAKILSVEEFSIHVVVPIIRAVLLLPLGVAAGVIAESSKQSRTLLPESPVFLALAALARARRAAWYRAASKSTANVFSTLHHGSGKALIVAECCTDGVSTRAGACGRVGGEGSGAGWRSDNYRCAQIRRQRIADILTIVLGSLAITESNIARWRGVVDGDDKVFDNWVLALRAADKKRRGRSVRETQRSVQMALVHTTYLSSIFQHS